jgi:hypothetical protein
MLGTLNNTFKPTLAQKCSRTKVYNAQAVPISLYGIEIWALRKKDKLKQFATTELNFFRITAVCTLFDHKRNEEI